MLVGKRRRMLRYLERTTSSATAPWSPNSACGDDRRRGAGSRLHPPHQDGEKVSLADFRGRKVLLVFYPLDFSPVCSDQLSIYQEVKPRVIEAGVELVGISVDSGFAHKAFQEKLGIDTALLADFEPKGEVARAYGSYIERVGHRQPHAGPGRRGRHGRVGARVADAARDPRRQRRSSDVPSALTPELHHPRKGTRGVSARAAVSATALAGCDRGRDGRGCGEWRGSLDASATGSSREGHGSRHGRLASRDRERGKSTLPCVLGNSHFSAACRLGPL